MASEFSREFFSANRIVKADLHCARQPREQDLDKIDHKPKLTSARCLPGKWIRNICYVKIADCYSCI